MLSMYGCLLYLVFGTGDDRIHQLIGRTVNERKFYLFCLLNKDLNTTL